MSSPLKPYSFLLPRDAFWRESNMMKIPNTNLAEQLGTEKLAARLWRLPPFSANTCLRQMFNDTEEEVLWLFFGAPRHEAGADRSTIYPEDPQQLPAELHDRKWPPA